MVYINPDSAYMRLLKPFLAKKKRFGLAPLGRDDAQVKYIWELVLQHLEEEIPEKFQNLDTHTTGAWRSRHLVSFVIRRCRSC